MLSMLEELAVGLVIFGLRIPIEILVYPLLDIAN